MANFTTSEVLNIMQKPKQIRNMSVIAHVDHGKSTLTDSLIASAGIISKQKQGDQRFMDTREDEQDRAITIKSTSISLIYDNEDAETKEKVPHLINLIDSPGHVDFSSEVTAALRTTDGALVVVDCVERVCTQTETVLRQALISGVRPILFLNKLDRVMLELDMASERIYTTFRSIIEDVNVLIGTYCQKSMDKKFENYRVSPEDGTVGFGSGLQGWAFTLESFYRKNYCDDRKKAAQAAKMFWGDRYYDPATKKWSKKQGKGVRGFCHFVMDPLKKMYADVLKHNPSKEDEKALEERLAQLKIKMTPEVRAYKSRKQVLKYILYTWMPGGEVLSDMIINKLPDPLEAARYRAALLYSGDLKDEEGKAIRACDAEGPLMMFISKMVPASEVGRFTAFGRVYSGRITAGEEVFILLPGEKKAKKTRIQKISLMMGRYVENISYCPAGNMVGLHGVDKYILKTATICNNPEAKPFKQMNFSVSPVVQQAVGVKKGSDLPKLLEGLTRLSKSDPLVKVVHDSRSGEHIICAAGELHIEICVKDLRDFCKGVEITLSKPVVTFRETITAESSSPEIACAKSANKHNRIFITAQPMDQDLVEDIIEGRLTMDMDTKQRSVFLRDKYGMDKSVGKKIMSLGHPESGLGNVLLNQIKNVQGFNEVKESIITAFMDFTSSGALCGEPTRGMWFNIVDATLHCDSVHRGPGQVIAMVRKALSAAQLASQPTLVEPVYSVDIQVPDSQMENAIKVINQLKGVHTDTEYNESNPMVNIKAELRVRKSFGFSKMIRAATGGKAFPNMTMDQWATVDGKVYPKDGSETEVLGIIKEVLERKGRPTTIHSASDFHDKL